MNIRSLMLLGLVCMGSMGIVLFSIVAAAQIKESFLNLMLRLYLLCFLCGILLGILTVDTIANKVPGWIHSHNNADGWKKTKREIHYRLLIFAILIVIVIEGISFYSFGCSNSIYCHKDRENIYSLETFAIIKPGMNPLGIFGNFRPGEKLIGCKEFPETPGDPFHDETASIPCP
jgi:hypothetical protein